jgi:hypothetical protein
MKDAFTSITPGSAALQVTLKAAMRSMEGES